MKAGKQFTDDLIARHIATNVTRVVVDVYGSLSLTGKATTLISPLLWARRSPAGHRRYRRAIPSFIGDVNAMGVLLLANGQHGNFRSNKCMNFRAGQPVSA